MSAQTATAPLLQIDGLSASYGGAGCYAMYP